MDRFAGIRGNTRSVSHKRGFPHDMSDECKDFYELETCKSHHDTYVTGRELIEVLNDIENPNETWTKDFYALKKMVEALIFIYGVENIRGIFWFYN